MTGKTVETNRAEWGVKVSKENWQLIILKDCIPMGSELLCAVGESHACCFFLTGKLILKERRQIYGYWSVHSFVLFTSETLAVKTSEALRTFFLRSCQARYQQLVRGDDLPQRCTINLKRDTFILEEWHSKLQIEQIKKLGSFTILVFLTAAMWCSNSL